MLFFFRCPSNKKESSRRLILCLKNSTSRRSSWNRLTAFQKTIDNKKLWGNFANIFAAAINPKDFSKVKAATRNIPIIANGLQDEGIKKCKSRNYYNFRRRGNRQCYLRNYEYLPIVRLIFLRSSISQLTITMIKKELETDWRAEEKYFNAGVSRRTRH